MVPVSSVGKFLGKELSFFLLVDLDYFDLG